MIDVFDDAVGVGGPDERLGFAVVFAGLPVDRGLQVDQRGKGAALQASMGKRGEEGLDHIRPRPLKPRQASLPWRHIDSS
jgi:hypothetical protein